MSASKSPCAACKFLRRKCTQECVFAPYFPPDNPQKFANVHKVFGASNVAKLLNELNTSQREDAVNSLEYEAKARLHDPVHGCVGLISVLQHRLHATRLTLEEARKDLAVYLGPQAMLPILSPAAIMQQGHHIGNPSAMQQQAMVPMMGIPTAPNQHLVIRDTQNPTHQHQQQQQQQFFENQAQLAAAMAARDAQYEMFRGYEQQQHHQHIQQQQEEIARFNAGFDGSGGSVTATGYNQIPAAGGGMSPSLALGTFDDPYQIHQAKQENHGHSHSLQEQLLFQPPPQQEQPQQAPDQKSGSEEVKSVALSC